jgi:hypothetical protein
MLLTKLRNRRSSMSKEIPQKGWYVLKEGNDPLVAGTKVYLDGKMVGGIQKVSIEIDAEKSLPVLKLEVFAVEGMTVDTVFGPSNYQPETPIVITTYRSSQSPEEILNGLEVKEKEAQVVETEVL